MWSVKNLEMKSPEINVRVFNPLTVVFLKRWQREETITWEWGKIGQHIYKPDSTQDL